MELQNRPDWQLLAKYASQTPQDAVFVEIGTHLGDSALVMAEAAPWATIWTIDTGERWVWEGNKIEDYRQFLVNRFVGRKIHFLRGSSHFREGMVEVGGFDWPIDLLPVDGDHNYDAVMSDLIRWAPKVKPGGYMLLHDYIIEDGKGEWDKVWGAIEDYIYVHREWEMLELVDTMLACQRTR